MNLKKHFNKKTLAFITFAFLMSCAKIVSPVGGEKDTEQPKVLGSVPSNQSTNFVDDEITLLFDEYVVLDNPSQILISPYMKERPEFKVRGKKLIIEFKEKLQSDITYTINFGKAIQDLNERNVLDNLYYTFATGEFIDSARVSGKVNITQSQESAEGIIVGLYPVSEDTLFKKQPPLYITQANKDGSFDIRNIANKPYEIVALEDKNFNLYFDLPNESIAFIDSTLNFTDTSFYQIQLQLFEESAPLQVQETINEQYGKTSIILSEEVQMLGFNWIGEKGLEDSIKVIKKEDKQSMTIWYSFKNKKNQALEILDGTSIIDTIEIDPPAKGKLDSLSFESNVIKQRSPLFDIDTPLILTFNYLLDKVDLSQMEVTEDSITLSNDAIQSEIIEEKLFLNYEWKGGSFYDISIPPQSIYDSFGQTNADSIFLNYKVRSLEDYGTLNIAFIGRDSLSTYLYELLNKKGDKTFEEGTLQDSLLVVDRIPAGGVKLVVIKDDNQNGRWDSGNYLEKRQAEKIFSSESTTVKANWETELQMKLD